MEMKEIWNSGSGMKFKKTQPNPNTLLAEVVYVYEAYLCFGRFSITLYMPVVREYKDGFTVICSLEINAGLRLSFK